jgi:hypothetical protein
MSHHLTPLRRLIATTAAGALVAAVPAGLLTPSATAAPALPTVMELPDNWLPEGIATVGHTAYLGSRADGDILRLDLRTGEYEVFSQGPGPGNPAVGIEAAHGLLLVAGGSTGRLPPAAAVRHHPSRRRCHHAAAVR